MHKGMKLMYKSLNSYKCIYQWTVINAEVREKSKWYFWSAVHINVRSVVKKWKINLEEK